MEGVDIERTPFRVATARQLRRIADALTAGKAFQVRINGRRVILPDDLQLEVNFDTGVRRGEIDIELSWDRKRRSATGHA